MKQQVSRAYFELAVYDRLTLYLVLDMQTHECSAVESYSRKADDQSSVHDNTIGSNLEHGAFPRTEKIQTGRSGLSAAKRPCHESLVFFVLASVSAAVMTCWNNTDNNARIESVYSARTQGVVCEFIVEAADD